MPKIAPSKTSVKAPRRPRRRYEPVYRVWKVRQHGLSKRRTWRKLHIGVNEATGEIVAQTLTTASVDDASQVAPLLDQVQTPVQTLGADGGYDKRKVFKPLAAPSPCARPKI